MTTNFQGSFSRAWIGALEEHFLEIKLKKTRLCMIVLYFFILKHMGTFWRHVGGTTSEPVPHHFLVKTFLPLENEQNFHGHFLEAAGVRPPHFLDDSLENGWNDPSVLISKGISISCQSSLNRFLFVQGRPILRSSPHSERQQRQSRWPGEDDC